MSQEIKIPDSWSNKGPVMNIPTTEKTPIPVELVSQKISKGLGYLDMDYKVRNDGYVEIWDTDKGTIVGVLNRERLTAVIDAFERLHQFL